MPLSMPPSVVALLWTDVGGVMPRLLGGSVGEYGLSVPLRFWYRVMGDQSVLSVEMGDRAPAILPLRAGGFIVFRAFNVTGGRVGDGRSWALWLSKSLVVNSAGVAVAGCRSSDETWGVGRDGVGRSAVVRDAGQRGVAVGNCGRQQQRSGRKGSVSGTV